MLGSRVSIWNFSLQDVCTARDSDLFHSSTTLQDAEKNFGQCYCQMRKSFPGPRKNPGDPWILLAIHSTQDQYTRGNTHNLPHEAQTVRKGIHFDVSRSEGDWKQAVSLRALVCTRKKDFSSQVLATHNEHIKRIGLLPKVGHSPYILLVDMSLFSVRCLLLWRSVFGSQSGGRGAVCVAFGWSYARLCVST